MKRYLIFGCSKGLGEAVFDKIKNAEDQFLLVSRTISAQSLQSANVKAIDFDCTQEKQYDSFFKDVDKFKPDHIFYFSGGGPYGDFTSKEFKDHQWAFKLNFLFPALLLHKYLLFPDLKQMVFTGSSVAEGEPDCRAASYAASKHALKGLITSVNLEKLNIDLRLFSPSYMATQLLPKNTFVYDQFIVDKPVEVAAEFVTWALNEKGQKHYTIDMRRR